MSIYNSPTWTYIPEHLSISQLIESSSSSIHPEKIIYEEAITGATVTYKVFKRQVRRTAYNLRHLLHLRPGQTVSISASSCIDYILTAHAIWWAGGIVNPLNNSLHPDEIVHAINLAKPHILVVDQTLFQKLPNVLSELGRRAPVVFTICDHNDQRHLEWRRLPINRSHSLTGELELHTPIMKPNFVARNTCAAILLSSGTTGQPKAVMLSHYNLVAVCYQLREDNPSNWRGDQREIFFPPLSHVYATYVCFTMNLWLGAYVCLMPRFNVDLYCRLLQDRSATLARIVPPVARILAESPVVRKYKYPALEYFSCSAAPLHEGTAAKLRKVFPGVALCQTYGCTELTGPCVQSGVHDKQLLSLSSVGTLIANSELRFLDFDGRDCGPRGPGEIVYRGPNAMMGFKDSSEETSNTIIDGGWVRTGDLGYLDEHGYLYITGRLKELIKYKGFQVSPMELESVLVQHPCVQEAAVIGIWNSGEETEVPRAYVVIDNDNFRKKISTPDISLALEEFVALKVSTYKRLRGGVVVVDALPRNANGKVLKKHLREMAKDDQIRGVNLTAKL